MPIDLKKIRSITAAAEAKITEQQRLAATQQHKEAQRRQTAFLQEMHQHADEAIKMIPQVIEEAARKGERSAIVYTISYDQVSVPTYQYKRIFRKGYTPRPFPDYVRKVYDYCKSSRLKPVIEYAQDSVDDVAYNRRYEIHVRW